MNTTVRRRLQAASPLATGAIAALALGACGSQPAAAPAPKPAAKIEPATTTDRVVIRDFTFRPATTVVKAGTRLTFVNDDRASHTATSTTGLFDTNGIDQGKRAAVVLRKPGTYAYFCAFHPYMKGRIVVR